MSLRGLLDTTVGIYRTADIGDKYGDATGSPVLVGTEKVTFNNPLRTAWNDDGPGGALDGKMYMHALKSADIRPGDIVKYVSGNVPPMVYAEVMSCFRPQGKLLETRVQPWLGKIPGQ